MSSSWTQSDLDAIEQAIAQGVRRVEYNDRTVEYRSLKEMLQTRDLIRRSLGKTKRANRILCEADKGVD